MGSGGALTPPHHRAVMMPRDICGLPFVFGGESSASIAVARDFAVARGCALCRVPVVGECLDIVHEAELLPLPVDLGATAHREPREVFIVPQIAEYRLHGATAAAAACAAYLGINSRPHARRRGLEFR